jgi:hypothetical protein
MVELKMKSRILSTIYQFYTMSSFRFSTICLSTTFHSINWTSTKNVVPNHILLYKNIFAILYIKYNIYAKNDIFNAADEYTYNEIEVEKGRFSENSLHLRILPHLNCVQLVLTCMQWITRHKCLATIHSRYDIPETNVTTRCLPKTLFTKSFFSAKSDTNRINCSRLQFSYAIQIRIEIAICKGQILHFIAKAI